MAERAAVAGVPGMQANTKSDGMSSGLTGNIHGQDVEAAAVHSKIQPPMHTPYGPPADNPFSQSYA